MKKFLSKNLVIAALAVGTSVGVANAQTLPIVEDFTFSGNLAANGWTAHSAAGTNPIDTTTGLTFTGHPGSGVGNAANVDNTSEDVHRTFDAVSSGAVYAGFLLNSSQLNAGYFAHLGPNPLGTNFRVRLFQLSDGTGDYELGLSWAGGSATHQTNLDLTFNTTYLVVLKYENIGIVDADDTMSLFVIPSGVPGTEPTPTLGPITALDASGTDVAGGIGAFGIRQYNANQRQVIDALRIGTTWNDAVLAPAVTAASIGSAWSQDGDIVVNFDTDPGAVTSGDFTLTINGVGAAVTGVSGTGNTRTLTTSATLTAGDSTVDNIAVAATAGTNAGNLDFYAYPPISLLQDGTVTAGTVVGIQATVNGKVDGGEGSGQEYSLQDANGANNGIFVEDSANVASVVTGNAVEVVGAVAETFGVTTISGITYFADLGAGITLTPEVVAAANFQASNPADTAPAEAYEGVLITVNGLTNATDANFGETAFAEGVKTDGLFYDARTAGDITALPDPSDIYNITGIGYFSFSEYKILPRSAADVERITSVNDWMMLH